jgi:hypothetical protein
MRKDLNLSAFLLAAPKLNRKETRDARLREGLRVASRPSFLCG